jgi:L-alanine-DL-glutamate epimerase-like enolase superfamily enzyme
MLMYFPGSCRFLDPPVFQVQDGKVAVPAGPGWGGTINPEWLNKAKREVSERA